MTVVVHGYCPHCGRPTGFAGATCYETPPVVRVVQCLCGSRRVPVDQQIYPQRIPSGTR